MLSDRFKQRIRVLLATITEGWTPGSLPTDPYAGPNLTVVPSLTSENARLIELDGLQCLIWYDESEQALILEPRIRNQWFPGHDWPGVYRSWQVTRGRGGDAKVAAEARACLTAVASVQQLRDTAVSECEGTTHSFVAEGEEPAWGHWAEQYLLANAVLGEKLTPAKARHMVERIRQAAVVYFGGEWDFDYEAVPDHVHAQFGRVGWLAMDILAGQTGITRAGTNQAFTA